MQRYDGHPDIGATLAAQGGLITRLQVLDTGMTPEHLKGLVHTGAWVIVRRGVYMPSHLWQELEPYDGPARMRARAAHLMMRRAHVLSHESAARELRLPILRPERELVHVTRRGVRGGRTEHGVKHHLAPYQPDQVVSPDGIPVLGAARTALDMAREHGYVHGLVACDAARQQGAALRDLWEAAAPMAFWPEVTVVRACIVDSDPGAESVGETLLRIMVRELGIGPVQTQFELRDATGWARCDLRVRRHLFEFDGRVKYQRPDRGGLALVDPDRVVWEEKQRQDWACGFQLGMSRVVWREFWGEPRRLALQRLAREYAATVARFGTDIADLRHVIVAERAAPAMSRGVRVTSPAS